MKALGNNKFQPAMWKINAHGKGVNWRYKKLLQKKKIKYNKD